MKDRDERFISVSIVTILVEYVKHLGQDFRWQKVLVAQDSTLERVLPRLDRLYNL